MTWPFFVTFSNIHFHESLFVGSKFVRKTFQSFMCLSFGFFHCVLHLAYPQPAVLVWSCISNCHFQCDEYHLTWKTVTLFTLRYISRISADGNRTAYQLLVVFVQQYINMNSELVLCLFNLCSEAVFCGLPCFCFPHQIYRITTVQNQCSRSFLAA